MLKTYYRLTKPGIVYGNLLAAAAGFLLACSWHFGWGLLAATMAGTALVIASACVYNNVIDKDIDAKMERTRQRGLPAHKLSETAALAYATALGVAGFVSLAIWTNWWVVGLEAVAFISYVFAYGWAKRHTVYGTLVGAIPGAIPPAAGYVAVTNRIDTTAGLLFLALGCWQIPHFYAIAMFRQKDYKAAGLPVWPLVRGLRSTKQQILIFTGLFSLACLAIGLASPAGLIFLLVMVGVGVYWLARGLAGFKSTDDILWGRQMFGLSLVVLLILCVMLSLGPLLP